MSKSFVKFMDVTQAGDHSQRYHVVSAQHGHVLGLLGWYHKWRQYVLEPEPGSIWSAGCLADVERFMRGLPLPAKGGRADA